MTLAVVRWSGAITSSSQLISPLFQSSADRLVKPYVGGYSLKNVIDMRASQDLYLIKH